MRYMIMHKTSAHWEAGAKPTPELIQRVGGMIGGMISAGIMVAGEGLGPSSQGVRVRIKDGRPGFEPGPFSGIDAVPARYALFRAATVEVAGGIAARFGGIFGDVVVDVRPVNEAWDLGFAPKPEGLKTRRYMATVNTDAASEIGAPLKPAQISALAAFTGELKNADAFLALEHFQPTAKGKRLRLPADGKGKHVVRDGPFTESKELIGGFATVEVPSIGDAVHWAGVYAAAVDVEEIDVRGLEP